MAEYIGLKISVQLQNGTKFTGEVADINGTKLRLINVLDSSTSSHVPSRVVDGSKIADLQIINPPAAEPTGSQKKKSRTAAAHSNGASFTPPQYNDPAILTLQSGDSQPAGSSTEDETTEGEESSTISSDLAAVHIYDGSPQPPKKTKKKNGRPADLHRREPSATHVPRPFANKRKNGRRFNGDYQDDSWVDEDTAEFKDTEFDFQSNLEKFNKKTVFDEIRLADTTDPTARLVSLNRKDGMNTVSAHDVQQEHIRALLKKPPKKDFLPTENVLGSTVAAWQSLSDSEDEETSQVVVQAVDEASDIDKEIRQQQRRISQARAMSRSSSRNATPPALRPPRRLVYDTGERMAFGCPTFTTEQILAVEQAATTLYSLTPEQLTENAGAAVAKLAISILGGKRRFERRRIQVNALPVVVVLAGNHETGARTIAGARMLVNRRVRVVVLFTDDSAELAAPKECIESQLRAFKAAGGKTTSRLDVLQATLRVLDAPPELVIDALTGIKLQDGVGSGVPGWMYEAAQFAATQRAPVMAVDMPAGVDTETGAVLVNNMGRAKWLLCLGMPSDGIPHYMQYVEEVLQSDLDVSVADIGLPSRCFKKTLSEMRASEGFRDGIVFGSEWSVPVKLE
ncbi:YjeF N-terminal domain-containing protein [Myxozyma melibiosi]|uniref:Enhancer of mRNA-decapping protein 3 n=1 Tax=Myxozyma melibiosi TaxID=54550 RepID=A0ABR1F146_9ASCO